MKVHYNSRDNVFEINDGLRTVYTVLIFILLLNIFNGVFYFIGHSVPPYNFLHYLWIGVGLASLVVLWMFVFRKSSRSKIPKEQIREVLEKKVLGKKKLLLKLKNGKTRDLPQMKTTADHLTLKSVFEDADFIVK